MDEITIRTATPADLGHILRHRRAMFAELGEQDADVLDRVIKASEQYFAGALEGGAYRAWLAETSHGEIIAGGGIVISDWPAMPSAIEPRRATILNMYTEPEFRKRGLARRLLLAMLQWLREERFSEVRLHASPFGRPLYEQLGFKPTNELCLAVDVRNCYSSFASGECRSNTPELCTSPDCLVRQATDADLAAIHSCLAAAFAPYRDLYTLSAFGDTVPSLSILRHRLDAMYLFVAVHDGKIIGTISCTKVGEEEGHLRGMAVLPEWQGKSVAAMLLAAAEHQLRKLGCSRVTLDTTEPLQRAIAFYQKRGFRASGRVNDFFGMRLCEYVKILTSVHTRERPTHTSTCS